VTRLILEGGLVRVRLEKGVSPVLGGSYGNKKRDVVLGSEGCLGRKDHAGLFWVTKK